MSVYNSYSSYFNQLQFTEATAVQEVAIPKIESGASLALAAPTGTGKTLCYLLPLLKKMEESKSLAASQAPRALILVPTREVGEQIQKVIEKINSQSKSNSKVALVVGGVPPKTQVSQLNKKPAFVIATPGRLAELLKNNKLLLQGTATVIFEEADRLLESNFSGPIMEVLKTLRGDWQALFVSATISPQFQNQVKKIYLGSFETLDLKDLVKPKIALEFIQVDSTRKREELLVIIQRLKGKALVFSYDQYVCEDVFSHLKSNGISVDRIHGQQSPGERLAVINNFRSGKYQVLISTDLLARGLDFSEVDTVINFDLPESVENFQHRIGRTGRAGRQGKAITLVAPIDFDKYKIISKSLEL